MEISVTFSSSPAAFRKFTSASKLWYGVNRILSFFEIASKSPFVFSRPLGIPGINFGKRSSCLSTGISFRSDAPSGPLVSKTSSGTRSRADTRCAVYPNGSSSGVSSLLGSLSESFCSWKMISSASSPFSTFSASRVSLTGITA